MLIPLFSQLLQTQNFLQASLMKITSKKQKIKLRGEEIKKLKNNNTTLKENILAQLVITKEIGQILPSKIKPNKKMT